SNPGKAKVTAGLACAAIHNLCKSLKIGDYVVTPDGTGKVVIDGISHPTADGTNGQALVTDGAGNLSFGSAGINTGKAIAMALVFG
ncbi:MAG: hypothetical protein VW810_00350, partial [Pelagibacteraceae bacterium]